MGFFKRNYGDAHIVKYTCSPVLEGKIFTVVGLVMVVVAVASALTGGEDGLRGCVLGGFFFAVLAGFGVYYWKFRRRPLRRDVVLGTWYARLYLRSRLLFVLASAGIGVLSYAVGMFVVTLVFDGTDALYPAFIDKLKSWVLLLVVILIGVCRDFANFYRYYRSPEYRRLLADDYGALKGERVKM